MNIKFVGNQGLFNHFESGTLDEVNHFIQTSSIVGLDIETTRRYARTQYASDVYEPGLDPYLTKICMIQVGNAYECFVIDARQFSDDQLARLFWHDVLWVGHNLKFEYKHIKHSYGVELNRVWDTFLAEKNLYNGLNIGFSLKHLAERYLDAKEAEVKNADLFSFWQDESEDEMTVNKEIRTQFLNIGSRPFTSEQIEYGAQDVEMAIKIYNQQKKGRYVLGSGLYHPEKLHKLEFEVMKVFADMELDGIPFSSKVWNNIYETSSLPRLQEKRQWLDDYVVANHPSFCKQSLFGNTCAIKWTSPQQVVAFFKYLGFCPLEYSKSKKAKVFSASSKAMAKVEVEEQYVELVKNYLKFKEAEQLCTLFGPDFNKYIHPITGKVHPNYNQIVHTGRPSCSNPNLLNIPSNGEHHRTAFIAPEGYSYIGFDFDSQELRVLADIANESVMKAALTTGDGDLHSKTAQDVYRVVNNEPDLVVSKALADKDNRINAFRQNGKILNFRILYGASAYTLKFELKESEETAQKMIDGYYMAYPALRPYFDSVFEQAKKTGYIVTDAKLDRRRFLPMHKQIKALREKAKPTRDERNMIDQYDKALLRLCQNNPIQGTSAGITKMAQILLNKELKSSGDSKLVVALYDELGVIAPDHDAERIAEKVKWAMTKAGSWFLSEVPLTATGKISKHWKH